MNIKHLYKVSNYLFIGLECAICISSNLHPIFNLILGVKNIKLGIFRSLAFFWQKRSNAMTELPTYLEYIWSSTIIDRINHIDTH